MSKEVSIIIPVYNAGKFLDETIKSILNQTYQDWELLLVDDGSTDNSIDVIKKIQKNDKRIKLLQNKKNVGPALSRNSGVKASKGRYICYLDADDFWDKQKLEKQVKFMQKQNCAFSFTGYEFTNSKGVLSGKKVSVPEKISYRQALKNTTICTTTVMFDMSKLTKEDILMPNVKSEDTACWWKVLKKVPYAYGLNEILSFYRRSEKTLSSNKFEAIKRIWFLYRRVEKINPILSLFYFACYAFNAVRRRI